MKRNTGLGSAIFDRSKCFLHVHAYSDTSYVDLAYESIWKHLTIAENNFLASQIHVTKSTPGC